MFCIDHSRGIIKTTEYFNLQPGRSLHFIMYYAVQNIFLFQYPNTPAFTVKVTSRCDLMTSLEKQLSQSCDSSYMEIANQGSANNARDVVTFDLKNYNQLQQNDYYLTQVNVNFTHMPNVFGGEKEDEGEETESNYLFVIGIQNEQGMSFFV